MDLDIVLDRDRAEVVALREKRLVEIAKAMTAVGDEGRLPEPAALPDRDRGGAREDDVVRQVGPGPDPDRAPVVDLGAERPAELDTRPDDEVPALGDVKAEPRSEVDRTLEDDVGLRISEQDPPHAQPRRKARAPEVADLPRRESELSHEASHWADGTEACPHGFRLDRRGPREHRIPSRE